MTDDVKFLLTVYGGIIAFLLVLLLLDWIGRRQERNAGTRKAT